MISTRVVLETNRHIDHLPKIPVSLLLRTSLRPPSNPFAQQYEMVCAHLCLVKIYLHLLLRLNEEAGIPERVTIIERSVKDVKIARSPEHTNSGIRSVESKEKLRLIQKLIVAITKMYSFKYLDQRFANHTAELHT